MEGEIHVQKFFLDLHVHVHVHLLSLPQRLLFHVHKYKVMN